MTDDYEPEREADGKFAKGSSGNPGGKPHGAWSPTKAMRHLLMMTPDELLAFEPQTVAEQLAKEWLLRAETGDGRGAMVNGMMKEVLNRVDGKVPDKVEVEGSQGIQVHFTEAKRDGDED